MNIGIVTIYDGNNMGSFLQAVALKMALEDLGHEVIFIERMTEEENLNMFVNRPFSRPRPFPLNYIARVKRAMLNGKEDRLRRQEIKKIYEVLSRERKNLKKIGSAEADKLDLIICGSDEIWNFRNTSISVPFYVCKDYGQNVRKIAYAVSIGTSEINDFMKKDEVLEAISGFDYVFPRDNHSKKVLSFLMNRELDIACDPTLLVKKERLVRNIKRDNNSRYILVYAYDLSDSEQKYLKRFSSEMRLPIISILHYLKIADEIITASPYDFGNIIADAEYCYTSTFHGTIFCTLFAKKFMYHARRPKVGEVANYLKIDDREWNIGSYDEFKSRMMETVDRERIEKTLTDIRESNVDRLIKTISMIGE